MDNKNWITQLAEKKPSPALVAGMTVTIMTLAGWLVAMYYEVGKVRSSEEEKARIVAISHHQEIQESKQEIKEVRLELSQCKNWIVQRTDSIFKDIRTELKGTIKEQKAIEARRSRLFAERSKLVKQNANTINTLENNEN